MPYGKENSIYQINQKGILIMLNPSMSKLIKKVDNTYLLVNAAAKRSRVISQRAEEEGMPLKEKAVTLALKDIANGVVTVKKVTAEETEQIG